MKKKILLLLSVFLLWGCQSTVTPTRTLKEHVTLSFFYIESCAQCKAFKQNAIPYLEKVYGDSLTIEQYDMDADETAPIYERTLEALADFDEQYYGQGPFIVVNNYFALLGYTEGDEEYLASDIEKAVNHEELSLELSRRMLYKEINK